MTMKKALITLVACCLFSASYAQSKQKIKGNRNVTVSETPINSFNRIVVGEEFKVDLIEGQEAEVFIETDENLQEVIKFNVADSTLYFSSSKRITTFKKMSIKVTYTRSLKQIEVQENGEVSSLTSLDLDELTLVNSGSSKSFLNVKTPKFKVINNERSKVKLNVTTSTATLELNDNSKLEALFTVDSMYVDMLQRSNSKIEGDVKSLEIVTDNYSVFNGRNLMAEEAVVNSDLNSNVFVNAINSLNIESRGNSEVFVYNTPAITLTTFEGAAKLHKKEMKKK